MAYIVRNDKFLLLYYADRITDKSSVSATLRWTRKNRRTPMMKHRSQTYWRPSMMTRMKTTQKHQAMMQQYLAQQQQQQHLQLRLGLVLKLKQARLKPTRNTAMPSLNFETTDVWFLFLTGRLFSTAQKLLEVASMALVSLWSVSYWTRLIVHSRMCSTNAK